MQTLGVGLDVIDRYPNHVMAGSHDWRIDCDERLIHGNQESPYQRGNRKSVAGQPF